MSEHKIDKVLEKLTDIEKAVAVINYQIIEKDRRLAQVEKDVKLLNQFKWGLVGSSILGLSAFFEKFM